jgi:hypothetical protein
LKDHVDPYRNEQGDCRKPDQARDDIAPAQFPHPIGHLHSSAPSMQRWRALRRGTVTRGFNVVSIHQDYFRTSMVGSAAWATISSGRWITAETLEATGRLFRNVSRHYRMRTWIKAASPRPRILVVWAAAADRDRASVHVTVVDVPAFLGSISRSAAGKFERAPIKAWPMPASDRIGVLPRGKNGASSETRLHVLTA